MREPHWRLTRFMTFSLVIDFVMSKELSNELQDCLKHCGLSDREIAQCNPSTCLYHDLGLYGDMAEAFLDMLVEQYQVNLTGFEFERYFPPEFIGKSALARILFWIVPFAAYAARRRSRWSPLTLDMIERLILSKRWG